MQTRIHAILRETSHRHSDILRHPEVLACSARRERRQILRKAPPALLFGRRGRAVVSRGPSCPFRVAHCKHAMCKGARNAGLSACPRPRVRKQKSTRASHHGRPKSPAFRARCEWLAPWRPLVETGFLSTTRARTFSGREPSAWASAARAYVLRPATATASRPASDDADRTPLAGGGMRNLLTREKGKIKEYYPNINDGELYVNRPSNPKLRRKSPISK